MRLCTWAQRYVPCALSCERLSSLKVSCSVGKTPRGYSPLSLLPNHPWVHSPHHNPARMVSPAETEGHLVIRYEKWEICVEEICRSMQSEFSKDLNESSLEKIEFALSSKRSNALVSLVGVSDNVQGAHFM